MTHTFALFGYVAHHTVRLSCDAGGGCGGMVPEAMSTERRALVVLSVAQ